MALRFVEFPVRTDHARIVDVRVQPRSNGYDMLVIQLDKKPDDRTDWLSLYHTRWRATTHLIAYAVPIDDLGDKPNPIWEVHVRFQHGLPLDEFARVGDRLYWGTGPPTHGRYKRK